MISEALKYLDIDKKNKKRNKNDKPESHIQDAICKYLNLKKWMVVRLNSSMLRIDNRVVKSYLIYGLGLSSGMPDVLAFKNNRVLLLEVKSPKGRISPNQKRVKKYAETRGNNYYIVRSVDDVAGILGEHYDL